MYLISLRIIIGSSRRLHLVCRVMRFVGMYEVMYYNIDRGCRSKIEEGISPRFRCSTSLLYILLKAGGIVTLNMNNIGLLCRD